MSIFEHEGVRILDLHPVMADFRAQVLEGLRQQPKRAPSLYLYDERGSELFEQITHQPEYYLPRIELSIMRDNLDEIVDTLGAECLLIEPGSGNSSKTALLLENLPDLAGYVPLDISRDFLARVAVDLAERYPRLDVLPVVADFHQPLMLPEVDRPIAARVVYFPGSTIGNFPPALQRRFLKQMGQLVGRDGYVLVGADLQKDVAMLEAAYDDSAGVSAAFALNLLDRLNRELKADFDVAQYAYEAPYNEDDHRVEMAIVSLRNQRASVAGERFEFAEGERYHTEYSYKFTLPGFAQLAASAGLRVEKVWTDPRKLFSMQLLTPA